jgi:hypothetical protein
LNRLNISPVLLGAPCGRAKVPAFPPGAQEQPQAVIDTGNTRQTNKSSRRLFWDTGNTRQAHTNGNA